MNFYVNTFLCAAAFIVIPRIVMAMKTKRKKIETLDDFGYYFNENGELRDKTSKEGFKFDVYENHAKNQDHYQSLSDIMKNYIYDLLESEGKLKRIRIPIEEDSVSKGKGFIFVSDDYENCEKLIMIIHGNGVVRAGQWSNRLIINHSLESGTQLPYIKKAKELGFGALVLNSNQIYDEETGEEIGCSKTPEDHFDYVWKTFVEKSSAKHIAIVAHSYGGVITTRCAASQPDVIKKTFAVAFTDSVHYKVKSKHQTLYDTWMQDNTCNWVTSKLDIDKLVREKPGDCPCVSAGTEAHIETSWKAFGSVWKFIIEKWEKRKNELENAVDEMKEIIKDSPTDVHIQSEL